MTSVRLRQEQVRALYEQHGHVLLAHGMSLLHDRSASEDVLHQVFVKLLQVELRSNGHWLEAPPGMEEIGLALQSAIGELPV